MRIETERLELLSATLEDAGLIFDLFKLPGVVEFLPPMPDWTIDEARKVVEGRIKLEAKIGYAPLIVRRKDRAEFIGNAGIRPLSGTPEIELMYHYLPAAWGKGFGTEAAVALLDHGLRVLGLEKIIALSMSGNVGSWRVMEKAGMRYEGLATYFGVEGLKKYVAEGATWAAPSRTS